MTPADPRHSRPPLPGGRRIVVAAAAIGVALAIAFTFGATVLSTQLGDAVAGGSPKRIAVDSSAALRTTTFFDPSSAEPAVWYAITPNGEMQLFAGPGRHPVTNAWLKPVTPGVVQLLERRLKAAEQARSDEEARRVATARADAEIARSRRRGRSDIAQATAELRRPLQPPEREAPANVPTDDAQSTPSQSTTAVLRAPPAMAGERAERPDDRPGTVASLAERGHAGGGRAADAPPIVSDRAKLAPAPRAGGDDDGDDRTLRYNALVAAARASIDAGRFDDARLHAQRAIHVDPRRMSARTLWAEAQTRLDARELPASRYERRFRD
jgi:hypothetical protein